jgi:hypothetical protein
MKARSCCRQASRWIAPSVGLVLIPKCPMCVAAYVTMLTGISISVAAASWVRLGMIVLCIAALVVVLTRSVTRLTPKSPKA